MVSSRAEDKNSSRASRTYSPFSRAEASRSRRIEADDIISSIRMSARPNDVWYFTAFRYVALIFDLSRICKASG